MVNFGRHFLNNCGANASNVPLVTVILDRRGKVVSLGTPEEGWNGCALLSPELLAGYLEVNQEKTNVRCIYDGGCERMV